MIKKSAIREMFSGKRGTYDDIELSDYFQQTSDKTAKAVDAFLEKLTPEQQKLFHDAYEFIGDKSAVYAEDHFVEGFKFGLLIGIETGESQIRQIK